MTGDVPVGGGLAVAAVRELPPPHPTIVPATDLGGVAVLKHGNLFLLADAFGDVHPDSRGLGLYELDTRVLSCAVLRINGVRPTLLRGQVTGNHSGVIQLTNPEQRLDPVDMPEGDLALALRSISISRRRWIADGFAERIEVTNYSEAPEHLVLDLDLDMDAADIFEVRGTLRARRGMYLPTVVTDESITFAYLGLDGLVRRTTVTFSPGEVGPGSPEADGTGGSARVRWALRVDPGAEASLGWRVTTELVPADEVDGASAAARFASDPATEADERASAAAAYRAWGEGATRIGSDGELLDLAISRSIADLRLLQNDGPDRGESYVAAGVPWFTTLFGRDAVISSLEALPFLPDMARSTLRILAAHQATAFDTQRDMQPGKILHELRSGEMARTGELLHRPYYGSVDATPLWLILLSETWRWTGDLDLVRSLWPNAEAAIDWIDTSGDLDGDGFVEYERHDPAGLANQGWKDSGDSIRHRDGSIAVAPIALAEVQGYVYDARLRVAELARVLGRDAYADAQERLAAELRRRFDEAFWMDDIGYYAVALDAGKRQVGSITSDAGHALWSGIVPDARIPRLAAMLAGPGLDCGWGIRTYAAGQPGFNPVGYHTGSVWPHDNAIVAAGLKRAGLHDAANRIATVIFEAARHSPDFRLPELYCGFDRADTDLPVPYPVACSPQAWSAAAPLFLLQTMLGLRAHAADGYLELHRPHLPPWLGKVTLHDLRIGDMSVDLLFHRWRGATSAEVLRRTGNLEVTIRV